MCNITEEFKEVRFWRTKIKSRVSYLGIFLYNDQEDGALAEKLGTGLQNQVDGSVTRTCLHFMLSFCASGGIGRREGLKIP